MNKRVETKLTLTTFSKCGCMSAGGIEVSSSSAKECTSTQSMSTRDRAAYKSCGYRGKSVER